MSKFFLARALLLYAYVFFGCVDISANSVELNQFGSSITAFVYQSGNYNEIGVTQSDNFEVFEGDQEGDRNSIMVLQSNGADNWIYVQQYGFLNELDILQQGYRNSAVLVQKGDRSNADIEQDGDFNNIEWDFMGDSTSFEVEQRGDDNNVDIRQFGNNHAMEIKQIGSWNYIDIQQLSGAIGNANMEQIGYANTMSIIQR